MYKVGDKVRVIKTGELYTSYLEWADRYGLTNYVRGADIPSCTQDKFGPAEGIWKVVAVDDNDARKLIAITSMTDDPTQFIIGVPGVELVSPYYELPDELFEL